MEPPGPAFGWPDDKLRDTHRVTMPKWRNADYRRNFLAGGSFFFAVNLAQRHLRLLAQHIDELRSAFRETRRHHPSVHDRCDGGAA